MCTLPDIDSTVDLALIASMLREARRYYALRMITRRTFDWRIKWITQRELEPHSLELRILEGSSRIPGFEIHSWEGETCLEIETGEESSPFRF